MHCCGFLEIPMASPRGRQHRGRANGFCTDLHYPTTTESDTPMLTTFGLLLFDGVEELDFVGPWEVFTASSMLRENTGEAADTIVTISEHDRPVRCSKGLRVLADHTFDNHPNLDVVLAPGGFGTRTEVDNPVLIDWLRNVAASCDWVTSVCTGSLLLHEAGPGRNRHLCPTGASKTPSKHAETAPLFAISVGL
jgi:putative intracellular protease/amidase